MHRLVFVAVIGCLFSIRSFASPLDPVLAIDNLWQMKHDGFVGATRQFGFDNSAREPDTLSSEQKDMTIYQVPVEKVVAHFGIGVLDKVTFIFYERHREDIPEVDFDKIVRDVADALTKATHTHFVVGPKDPAALYNTDTLLWSTERAQFALEYSKTKEMKTRDIPFRSYFVRLSVTPAAKKQQSPLAAAPVLKTKFIPAEHVKKNAETGDVWIADIPMVTGSTKTVDFWVAQVERIARYYGNTVDETELQSLTVSTTANAYNIDDVLNRTSQYFTRLKLRRRELENIMNSKGTAKFLNDYNRYAKMVGVPPLSPTTDASGKSVPLSYDMFSPDVVRTMRTKDKTEIHRFLREVQMHVDAGAPMIWRANVGWLVNQTFASQVQGPTTCLLNGYNPRTQEIIYSDSYSKGHEMLRVSLEDAWTVTMSLDVVESM